ncbi:MAG TPA: anthranilate phosphoribosyltransferase [Candidatus Eisenbacteria bacterium]|nr:anthranilate phosphoribosyltransferase [Candidatus Eisenbacteria bacterium]
MIRDLLPRLLAGETLSRAEAAAAVRSMVRGESEDGLVASFLTLLAQRGETEAELWGGAEALRAEAVPFPWNGGALFDTCGTGGDGRGSFNVSTTAAFVVAGAGVRVAKHGNRSVSSACGSADVLESLGAHIDLGPEGAAAVLAETGFTFLYARRFHPAMRRVAGVRQTLGFRTLFNWLGPLSNPARATHQLVGVPDAARVEPVARVLAGLGAVRALVVHGAGGLDELALAPGNLAAESARSETGAPAALPRSIRHDALGLRDAPLEALRGGDADRNAALLREVLAGEPGPRRDAVLLNAAAALWIAGAAPTLDDALARATQAIDRGDARKVLDHYIELSKKVGSE